LWKKFAALSLKYIDLFDYFNFMKLEFIFSPYDTNDEDIGSLAQSDAEWKLLQFYHYLISKPEIISFYLSPMPLEGANFPPSLRT
jgi:hypothetical protein